MAAYSNSFSEERPESNASATGDNSGISFSCPHCNQHLAADTDMAGLSLECPACGKALVVPTPREEATPKIRILASTDNRPAGRGRKWRKIALAMVIVAATAIVVGTAIHCSGSGDPSVIRITVRKMAPDLEMYNEIAYWHDKMDGGLEAFESAQKALLQEYDQVKLSPKTLDLRDDFLATFEQVALLLQARQAISAQREQYIEQAKRQGVVQALSQIASGAQSQGEAGAWLALFGAAAEFADVEKGAAAQVDQAIAEINEKLKTCFNEFTRKQREYQKGKPYSSFDKSRIFDAQSFRMKYLAGQMEFLQMDWTLSDADLQKVILANVRQVLLGYNEMLQYKIPEVASDQFKVYDEARRVIDTLIAENSLPDGDERHHKVQLVIEVLNNFEIAMATMAIAQYPQSRTPNSPIMNMLRSHEKDIDKKLFRIKVN